MENSDGITITPDGNVSFASPGIYHVRVRGTKANVSSSEADSYDVFSDWVEIRVKEILPARVLKAPTAKDYYNAESPALLNKDGTYEGGLGFLYGVSSDDITEPAEYSTEIPTATGAGTYYVWCKVHPDDSHSDSESVCVTATLESASGDGGDDGDSGDSDSDNSIGATSSSSGCNMGLGGLMITALAVMMLRRR